MRKAIKDYVSNRVECQKYKPRNTLPVGLLQTSAPQRRFETVSIDLSGPLPASPTNKRWILITEDVATKWVELFPLEIATAEAVAKTFINEICLRFGTPRKLISDNGTQFVSQVMQCVTNAFGISQALIPSYHPEANPVERKNRDLKTQLEIQIGQGDHSAWEEKLPSIRFAMNTAHCQSTGYSPAYLVFGNELRTPGDTSRDLRTTIDHGNFIQEIVPYLRKLAETLETGRETEEIQKDQR